MTKIFRSEGIPHLKNAVTKIISIGDEIAVLIPNDIARGAGMQVDDEVAVRASSNGLIIEKVKPFSTL